ERVGPKIPHPLELADLLVHLDQLGRPLGVVFDRLLVFFGSMVFHWGSFSAAGPEGRAVPRRWASLSAPPRASARARCSNPAPPRSGSPRGSRARGPAAPP